MRVTIIRGGSSDAGVHVGGGMDNVSDEIPELKRGGEAVAVFERLRREGYILGDFGSRGPSSFETPVLYGLSTKGMIDIGKFPDPEARLATAIEAAHHAIEREPSIPETKKRDMLDTTEKMASLANNVGGLSRAFFDGLSQGG